MLLREHLMKNIKHIRAYFLMVILFSCFGSFIFYRSFFHYYYIFKYNSEVAQIRKILTLIRTSNYDEIKKISTKNAHFLKPAILKEFKQILCDVDMDSLRLRYIYQPKNETNKFLIEVYFDYDIRKSIKIILVKNNSNNLLFKAFSVSEILWLS